MIREKVRSIQMIITEELKLKNKKKAQLVKGLQHKFIPIKGLDNEENGDDSGYEYLPSMKLWTLTKARTEKIELEETEKRQHLTNVQEKTPKSQRRSSPRQSGGDVATAVRWN